MGDAEAQAAAGTSSSAARKVQGFALKAKAGPKLHRKPSEASRPADVPKDEVLAIDAKGIESKVKKVKEAPKVIPSLANDWKLHGVRKDNAAAATAAADSLDEQAVAALVSDAKRREGGVEDENEGKVSMVIEGGGMSAEQLESDSQLGAAAGVAAKGKQDAASEKNEDQKYREDVAWRPKEADVHSASWDAMPVEAFGSALLRGMGWQPGKGIGLNAKGPAAAVEYIPRHQRLGLGATPKAPEPKKGKWIPKQGETREPKPDMVYRNEDGVQKHRKLIDEKLELREKKIEPGADIEIVGGRHAGMRGVVRSMEEMTGNVCIELRNGEEVTSKFADLVLFRDDADGDNSRRHDLTRSQGSSGKHKREKEHKHKKHKKEHKHKKHKSEKGTESSKDLWVATGLRVRIVDQDLGGGRHYNKKGVVQDVHGRKEILLQLDGSTRELVDGCSQSYLETIVPKPSAGDGRALVMVVRGKSKGRYADVLERSSGENRVVVQLKHDDSVAELTMDDVCEYVGGLEDEDND
jgi:G patch domain/KOW motif-containing protein